LRNYLSSFTVKRIVLLSTSIIVVELLLLYLLQNEQSLLCAKRFCEYFKPLPDNSTFETARVSLLSYYSSQASSHATLILSLLIAVFTVVQIRKKVKRFFPFLLSIIFSLITYLSVRFFVWSQLSARVLGAQPINLNDTVPSIIQFTATKSLFTIDNRFFIYFTYFIYPYYIAVFFVILLSTLAIIYFFRYLLEENPKESIQAPANHPANTAFTE